MFHNKCNFKELRCSKCKIKDLEESVLILQESIKQQSTAMTALHQILINQSHAIELHELGLNASESRLNALYNAPPVYKPAL
jgi:hypothetical protein